MDIILEENNSYRILTIPAVTEELINFYKEVKTEDGYNAMSEILDADEIFYNCTKHLHGEDLLNTLLERGIKFHVKVALVNYNLSGLRCSHDCIDRATDCCILCENNHKYSNNFNDGYNIECESSVCAFNKNTKGVCRMHLGKGKVKYCKDEVMPF